MLPILTSFSAVSEYLDYVKSNTILGQRVCLTALSESVRKHLGNTPTSRNCSLFAQVESLEANHEALAARARTAAQAEKKAVADRADAEARADSAERSAAGRVRDLEEEAGRLRRQLGTGADAAQAREDETHTVVTSEPFDSWRRVCVDAMFAWPPSSPQPVPPCSHGLNSSCGSPPSPREMSTYSSTENGADASGVLYVQVSPLLERLCV